MGVCLYMTGPTCSFRFQTKLITLPVLPAFGYYSAFSVTELPGGREKQCPLQFSFSFLSHFFSKSSPSFLELFSSPLHWNLPNKERFYFRSFRVSLLKDAATSSLKVNPGVWYLTAVLSFLLA